MCTRLPVMCWRHAEEFSSIGYAALTKTNSAVGETRTRFIEVGRLCHLVTISLKNKIYKELKIK